MHVNRGIQLRGSNHRLTEHAQRVQRNPSKEKGEGVRLLVRQATNLRLPRHSGSVSLLRARPRSACNREKGTVSIGGGMPGLANSSTAVISGG